MGRINKILSFIRVTRNGAKVTDVKCDPGGGANVTAEHFSAPGDDSFPLKTDLAVTIPVSGTGRRVVVGYLDPVNDPQAESGERHLYGRDSDGNIVSFVFLKNDGVLHLNGSDDYAVRYAAFETKIKELESNLNAFIELYNAHTQVVSGSTAAAPTSTATLSNVDFTSAKVDTVRLP